MKHVTAEVATQPQTAIAHAAAAAAAATSVTTATAAAHFMFHDLPHQHRTVATNSACKHICSSHTVRNAACLPVY
eukprot:15266-Heterococcus_DN1.PRE.1